MITRDFVIKKVFRRYVWLLLIVYFFAGLDRANIGFASLSMNKDLGLTAQMYGFAAGLYFLGYILFEIPNLTLLNKLGTRRWLTTIMIVWGVVSTCTMFVQSSSSLNVLRFLLGVAEAGFTPGVLIFLTHWFPETHRARINGIFFLGAPIVSTLGSLLSGVVLKLDGVLGVAGWKWLFLLEGIPSVLLGVVVYFYLSDRPFEAKWLTHEEKEILQNNLGEKSKDRKSEHKIGFLKAFTNPTVLFFGLAYFGIQTLSTGNAFWMPQIIKGLHLEDSMVAFVSAIPPFIGAIAMYFWGRHSDKTHERIWHAFIAAVICSVGWFVGAMLQSPVLLICALTVGSIGFYSLLAVFWTIPTKLFSGISATSAVAAISLIGNTGSFIMPQVIGKIRDVTGGFTGAFLLISSSILLTGIIILIVGNRKAKVTYSVSSAEERLG
ncbi:MFS transporter [Bacillus sp. sid0103]|uniref:MFS transporter n=1 Tax=Bacillus sp. sid0103 TaxID=2856337 RepID=UPI001C4533FF|nr:MFS transporter [Bacillus sp. sid0103]MBV7508286.1 MFS transporter [Bacillus sp. sid0103]